MLHTDTYTHTSHTDQPSRLLYTEGDSDQYLLGNYNDRDSTA